LKRIIEEDQNEINIERYLPEVGIFYMLSPSLEFLERE
jgi:hypothetical protein